MKLRCIILVFCKRIQYQLNARRNLRSARASRRRDIRKATNSLISGLAKERPDGFLCWDFMGEDIYLTAARKLGISIRFTREIKGDRKIYLLK